MTQSPRDSWITHALESAPWRDQQQAGSLALAVVVIVAVIGALYLAQASATAAAGRRLQDLEAQRQVLEQENAQLRAEIAALRSVPRLIAEAQRLGYRPAGPQDVEYVRLDGLVPPPALDEPGIPQPGDEGDDLEVYQETLESWLSRRFASARQSVRAFFRNTFGAAETP
jgi:hypothetical protein